MTSMSAAEYRAKAPKPRKYRNEPVVIDGVRFDSKRESIRWHVLRLLERAGDIKDLKRQVRYQLTAHGLPICVYIADFSYIDAATRTPVTEDLKGFETEVFKLKAKLFAAQFGREIKVTK
jgi:hypothetical protein